MADDLKRVVAWKNLPMNGTDYCGLWHTAEGWLLKGTVVGVLKDQRPMLASYEIHCDENWLTHRVQVERTIGSDVKTLSLSVENRGVWRNTSLPLEPRRSIQRRVASAAIVGIVRTLGRLCQIGAAPTKERPSSLYPQTTVGLARIYTQWKMKPSGLAFAVSAAASLIFLMARPLTAAEWPVIFKVLSIFLLAALGFRVEGLLGSALALSSVGDFLLGVRRLGSLDERSLFLFGLCSFLIVHLVYIALFRKYKASVWWKPSAARVWCVLTILVALSSVLGILRHSLGSMLIPVVVYSLVLSCMGISAMLADLRSPLAGFGALLFIASDAMIAINKFHGSFPGHEQLIWITYYSAQFLILRGVERGHSREQRTP